MNKYKSKTMYQVYGLEGKSSGDKNLYSSLEQAELNSPTPAYLKKVNVIVITPSYKQL